jgi:multidrug efflux pump subunit AcrA (membrane-fusion protein)
VFAEWDGIVASIGVAVGDHVSPEDPEFIQIATTLAVLEVLVELPPPDLKRLQPGDEALVSIQEVPSAALTARVSEVRDDAAVVEFQNPSPEVKPGMNARVQFRPAR